MVPNEKMKFLIAVVFKTTFLVSLLFIPQLTLANQEEIKNLQQREELLEETLKNYRLGTQAGIKTLSFGEFKSLITEMLEVKLKIIDVSEVKNPQAARIKVLERVLNLALEKEKETELLFKAGIGRIDDTLAAKSWRLDIQTRLEQEKGLQ